MKTRLGVLIFVLFAGMVFIAAQPALVCGGETPSGNLWDPFVDVSFFTLKPTSYPKVISLAAHLSIAYEAGSFFSFCGNGQYRGTLFYTVRSPDTSKFPWIYSSFTPNICFGDIGTPGSGGQGDAIMGFLKTVVLQLFPFARDAYLQSVSNPWMQDDAFAFTADIIIAVRMW